MRYQRTWPPRARSRGTRVPRVGARRCARASRPRPPRPGESVEGGRVVVGVNRRLARLFFTRTDRHVVAGLIGEQLGGERRAVATLLALAELAGVASYIAAVWAFGWWSLVVIPISSAAWSAALDGSPTTRVGWAAPTAVVASLVVIAALGAGARGAGRAWLATVAAALALASLADWVAVTRLRRLVRRNPRALAELRGSAVFVEAHGTAG